MRLADDPRWRRLSDPHFECPCCGKAHGGLFDIAYDHPDPFPMPPEGVMPNAAILQPGDVLTEDFCRMGDAYMVRAVLPMTLEGSAEAGGQVMFAFGVWGSLSRENFDAMVESFDSRDQSHLGPYFSWLMNRLPGASTQPPRCQMIPQPGGNRPVMLLVDEDHPFYAAQQSTITFDEVLDLYAFTGHDLRPHLLDG